MVDAPTTTRLCPTCGGDSADHYTGSSYCRPCHRARTAQWGAQNKARKLEINRAWRERHPERRRILNTCHNRLHAALRAGEITKGDTCAFCNSPNHIEAAHFDYSEPLNVVWLCRPCHRQWDAASPKTTTTDNFPSKGTGTRNIGDQPYGN